MLMYVLLIIIDMEKIIGWALSHHFMHCTEPSLKDTKLSISTERLVY